MNHGGNQEGLVNQPGTGVEAFPDEEFHESFPDQKGTFIKKVK